MTRKQIIHMVFACMMALSACTTTLPHDTPPTIYWPLPPAEPRVKYIDYILGSRDVTGVRSSISKILLFGEEPEVRFNKPSFVSSTNNRLFVTDINRLLILDYNTSKFSSSGTSLLRNATGLVALSDGRVIVGDSALGMLFVFAPPAYQGIRFSDTSIKFSSIGGLAADEDKGRLYAVDTKNHRIVVTDLKGNLIKTMGRRGGGKGDFNYPYDLAIGPEGRLYVVDSGNFRIQVFDSEGSFITAFGAAGSHLGAFARPKGIAVDSEGHIYVVDSAFGNFQIFDETGLLYLSVGGTGSEPGMNVLPMGIHIDPDDKIYLVDQINRRIQIYQYIRHPEEPRPPIVMPKP